MKSIWKNTIFRDPEGWAEKTVGSPLRYRFMQLVSILSGVMLMLMIILISSKVSEVQRAHPITFLGILVFVFGAVVELPLCYLRALRHYVAESQKREINNRKVA